MLPFPVQCGFTGDMMIDDMELVRQYARGKSEEAFAALVARHVNLVYSVAFRQVHDAHLAEEIAQTAFIILARKAGSLCPKTVVSSWLCQTARYVSTRALTMQFRRQRREQEAYLQSQSSEKEANVWEQIEPLLDSAMARLGERNHQALVLRFFDGQSFKDVGAAMGTSEAGAKMRVNRALEQLRKFFAKRGVNLAAAVIAGAVSANCVQAAPAGLATVVTTAAVKGSALTATTLNLTQTTLKFMAWIKLKTAAVVGVVIILAAGTATITIQRGKANAGPSPYVFSGYATPEMAIESTLWTASKGDLEKSLAGLTPDEAERFKMRLAGKTDDEIKQSLTSWAQAMQGYQITARDTVSPDEVHLHLRAAPSVDALQNGTAVIIMKRMGDAWKKAGDTN